jgi:hypothetical protein
LTRYARESTDDQSTALQLAALKRAGCRTIFKDEGLSGATTKRPALLRCLKALQDRDTLFSVFGGFGNCIYVLRYYKQARPEFWARRCEAFW